MGWQKRQQKDSLIAEIIRQLKAKGIDRKRIRLNLCCYNATANEDRGAMLPIAVLDISCTIPILAIRMRLHNSKKESKRSILYQKIANCPVTTIPLSSDPAQVATILNLYFPD